MLRLLVRRTGSSPPQLVAVTRIGSGFSEQTNASAFVIGPTGVGLGRSGTLYVADTGENRITAHPVRGDAHVERWHRVRGHLGGKLNAPLGLAIAPNGDVLTVNGGDGRIVETTPAGAQVATASWTRSGSPPGSGALFGLAVAPAGPASTTWTTRPTHCGCCTDPASMSRRPSRATRRVRGGAPDSARRPESSVRAVLGRVAPPPVRSGGLAATRRQRFLRQSKECARSEQ